MKLVEFFPSIFKSFFVSHPCAKLFATCVAMTVCFAAIDLTVPSNVASASTMTTEQMVDRERKRLEEVFIWKMSEELRLSVEIETTFAEAIRALNREKSSANSEVSMALVALEKSKSPKERDQALKRYERAWRTYGELPIREVSRMKPILGVEKLGQYLVAKSQMAERLKALSTQSSPGNAGKSAPIEAATPGSK